MQTTPRYQKAIWPNLLALLYVITAYGGGLTLILSQSVLLNIIGVLLLAHGMVIAAYLVHECAHNNIFRKSQWHKWLGEALLWICGASYSRYDTIRHKHVRHHTDRADIVAFDYRTRITRYPVLLGIIKALEWCYIPAMEIVMHAMTIVLPFVKPEYHDRRRRVLFVVFIRALLFMYFASISISFIVLYPLAYMIFLTVMRFMDVHQHTYDLYETLDQKRGDEVKKYDREFEQKNTYSNVLSMKYPWLNLLVLNFPYHNAHHKQPGRPWYLLPRLHNELYGDDDTQVLSFADLLKSYHRYRVKRILNGDAINSPVKTLGPDFVGVDGVSFLVTI